MLTSAEWIKSVRRTMQDGMTDGNLRAGIIGEIGETIDYIKKVLYHGIEFDKLKLTKELGDAAWYVTAYGSKHNFPVIFNINYIHNIDVRDDVEELMEELICLVPYILDPEDMNSSFTTFMSLICSRFDIDPQDVFIQNKLKLEARYKDGFVEGGGER